MILELAKPGTVENIVIKAQHNCWSDQQSYSGRFIPIEHEYLLIVKKDNLLVFNVQMARDIQVDMRDLKVSTWRDILYGILDSMGGKATLTELYQAVEGHKRTKAGGNTHWKEKVRQTLHEGKCFVQGQAGEWALAA